MSMGIVEILKEVGFAGDTYIFYVVLHGIILGDGFTSKSISRSSFLRQFDPPRPAPFRREFSAKQPQSLPRYPRAPFSVLA